MNDKETLKYFESLAKPIHFKAKNGGGTFEPLKLRNVGAFVDREGGYSAIDQDMRELVINALEAGAKNVLLTPFWPLMEAGVPGVKFAIIDDGCGLTKAELIEHFAALSASGGVISNITNFGMGAKLTTLTKSPDGVYVVSLKKSAWTMIRLCRDQDTGNYGLGRFVDPDTGECDNNITPPEQFQQYFHETFPKAKSGTMVVLLGRQKDEDTFMAADQQPVGVYRPVHSRVTYLNKRLFDIPKGVSIRVEEFQYSDKSNWPKSREDKRNPEGVVKCLARTVRGGRDLLKSAKHHGMVVLQDTRIHWYLMGKENEEFAGTGPFNDTRGRVATMLDGELYDIWYANEAAGKNVFRSFGIPYNEVMSQLFLVVEPLVKGKPGYTTNSIRSSLLYYGNEASGSEVPIARIGEEFIAKMPEKIKMAVKAATPEMDAGLATCLDHDDIVKEAIAQMYSPTYRKQKGGPLLAVVPGTTPESHLNGDGTGTPGGNGVGLKVVETGKKLGLRKENRTPTCPKFKWVNEDSPEDVNFNQQIAVYDGTNHILWLNNDYWLVEQRIATYQAAWAHKTKGDSGLEGVVADAVRNTYARHLGMKIAHSRQLSHSPGFTDDMMRELLEKPEILSLMSLGIYWEHCNQAIAGALGKQATGKAAIPDVIKPKKAGGK